MDPVTGTFTTMDTYGGSLSDPMSLHKYLFANSNPVMYCDPSGHYTLSEQETAIAIQAIIGEAMSGIFYIADWLITDPGSENHSIPMMIVTMMTGLLQGAVMGCGGGLISGLLAKAGMSVLDYILTGIMFTLFSWDLKLAALNMKESGNWLVASLCDAGGDFAGVVAFASIYNGIAKGWNALKDKVPRNWTKNKKGYVNIGFKSEDNHNSNLNDTLNGVLNRTNYKKYDVDCSEIAEDFYVAANGEGEILHIESTQKTIFVNTYGIAEAYDYHEVYSYEGMIYDPRYSNVPVPKSQYFNMINDLNSGGFSVWTITN